MAHAREMLRRPACLGRKSNFESRSQNHDIDSCLISSCVVKKARKVCRRYGNYPHTWCEASGSSTAQYPRRMDLIVGLLVENKT